MEPLRGRRVDRLVLGLGAWATAFFLFLGWSALRAVDPLYVQDAWEFIGRVELATSPAAAILAASRRDVGVALGGGAARGQRVARRRSALDRSQGAWRLGFLTLLRAVRRARAFEARSR